MSSETEWPPTWDETASRIFIEHGAAFVPWRDLIGKMIVRLMPAGSDETFTFVDVGAGTGWLSEAILVGFPNSKVIALDGSPMMLGELKRRLQPYSYRFTTKEFELQDHGWLDDLHDPVRAFVSCLAIHHLDDSEKAGLYGRMHDRLEPGGAVLIADVIRPASEYARRAYQAAYEDDVRRASVEVTGNLEAYHRFLELEWNLFRHPDPVDKPSQIPDHLRWMEESRFNAVDVFWAQSGHALYGGYKLDR